MTILLEAARLIFAVGDRTLFRREKPLVLHSRDRVGVVGANGSGETTLLRVLAGELASGGGIVRRFTPVFLIAQDREGREKETGPSGRSGGERTREKIHAALAAGAPVLFADEPTSHLDVEGIRELEGRLQAYPGCVVLVSHDRQLLDAVCHRIVEVTDGELTDYAGNYSDYVRQRREGRERRLFEYDRYVRERKRLERAAVAKAQQARTMKKKPKRMSYKEANLGKAGAGTRQAKVDQAMQAIRGRLERLEVKERPPEEKAPLFDRSRHPGVASRHVLDVARLSARAGNRVLFRDAAFSVPTGAKVALVGRNGAGKTALLNLLGADAAESGVRWAPSARVGRFAQFQEHVDPEATLLDNVAESSGYGIAEIRTALARMGFRREDAGKPAGLLSGGERVKVGLAKLLFASRNVLLLDEPNNYLDIPACEALEEALADYPGTLLFATHDRRLISRIATHLIVLEDGGCRWFQGTYEEYIEEKRRRSEPADDAAREERKLLLERELAEIVGRLAMVRSNEERNALDRRFQELHREKRRL